MAPELGRQASLDISSISSASSDLNKSIRMKKLQGFENANFVDDNGDQVPITPAMKNHIRIDIDGEPIDAVVEDDPWKIVDVLDSGPPWKEMSGKEKAKLSAINTAKVILLIGLLYFFVCALDILTSAFRLLAGREAGVIFHQNELLNNPVAGLMIGVMATVILQSSSTTTSIIVAMVGSEILKVDVATFIIMGANIGTSVTSTIVAMTQVGDREVFRRAFAGGTVHDMFNWLTVLILLPLEWGTRYLVILTDAITKSLQTNSGSDSGGNLANMQFLQAVTRPLTNLIVMVDEKAIEEAALDQNNHVAGSLLRTVCGTKNESDSNGLFTPQNISCTHIFVGTTISDTGVGLILLFAALLVICGSLILLVKTLSGMLKGSVANIIKKIINYDFRSPFGFVTGYLAILVGAGVTLIVQSSSVFTSILTPLVGMGVISIERMYPLTLGSNLGTTMTSLLAAFAAPSSTVFLAIQTALIHLFFNLSGVALWYPIPYLRMLPISAAKVLGDTTARYRWFAIVYVLSVFLLLPGLVFGLSLAGWQYLAGIGGPIFVLALTVIVINVLQNRAPKVLPNSLRTWDWLPKPLRSLEPMDRVMRMILGVFPCCRKMLAEEQDVRSEPLTILHDPAEPDQSTYIRETSLVEESIEKEYDAELHKSARL